MTVRLTLALVLVAATTLHAQENQRPKTWKVRYDRPSADTAKMEFVTMTPGWHVTTHSNAGIMYDPATSATGNFTAEALIHLFKPEGSHPEAYGIFVGGKDLEGAGQSYVYFLLRTDGKFLVKQRVGSATKDIVAPSASPAVKLYDPKESSVPNTLAIAAGPKTVDFMVNGTTVASTPRADLPVDGVVGLRANHQINIHVQTLKVTPK